MEKVSVNGKGVEKVSVNGIDKKEKVSVNGIDIFQCEPEDATRLAIYGGGASRSDL